MYAGRLRVTSTCMTRNLYVFIRSEVVCFRWLYVTVTTMKHKKSQKNLIGRLYDNF